MRYYLPGAVDIINTGSSSRRIVCPAFTGTIRAVGGNQVVVIIIAITGSPSGPVGNRGQAVGGVIAIVHGLAVGIGHGGEIADAIIGIADGVAPRIGIAGNPVQGVIFPADGSGGIAYV